MTRREGEQPNFNAGSAPTLKTCMPALHDMHCHLDFARDPQSFARDAAQDSSHVFANTVTPAGFRQARELLSGSNNIHLGIGLHPWYITDADTQVEQLLSSLDSTNFVGEIGLDFGKKKIETAEIQRVVLRTILEACGKQGGKLISLHAIKSADAVLDMLEASGSLTSCSCIFHWFSGSNDELHRAIKSGCYFSVGPFMANSRRGREYIKVIPAKQLLLETDYPPTNEGATPDPTTGEPRVDLSYQDVRKALEIAAQAVSERKGAEILQDIGKNSLELFEKHS